MIASNRLTFRDEKLLVIGLFIALLLSGAVQYYNIFILALLGGCMAVLLLARVHWVISNEFRWLFLPLTIYLSYVLLLDFSASGFTYIFFRLYDLLLALILINFAIQRRIDFTHALLKVLKFVSIHALCNWIVVTSFFDYFSYASDIKSLQLFYVFFGMSEQSFGLYRSQGFFWEPGVLQIFMNLGLLISIFSVKSTGWALFFLWNVMLTQSTTGIVVSAALLALKFFESKAHVSISRLVYTVFFLIILGALFLASATAVEAKIFGDGMGSALARYYDLQLGLSVIRDYPLGIGFNPQNYFYFAENDVYGIDLGLERSRDQTNGWLTLFISSGVFWGAVIVLSLVRQHLMPENRLAVFAFLCLCLATEPVFFSPFVMFFLLYPKKRIQALP